jgi:hypothetical protein
MLHSRLLRRQLLALSSFLAHGMIAQIYFVVCLATLDLEL